MDRIESNNISMAAFEPYTWPNPSFPFRLLFKNKKCRVFLIESFPHNWNWLKKYRDHIGPKDYFFVHENCYYSHSVVEGHRKIFSLLDLNPDNFYFLSNSDSTHKRILDMGLRGDVCNVNAWLDWGKYSIGSEQRKYDAVYKSRLVPFKRHELALDIPSLALISPDAPNQTTNGLDNLAYINKSELMDGGISQVFAQAACGLALAEFDGPCHESSEYLLSGLPVVSTGSFGGRDDWYDEYNSIICESTPEAVADAVKFFVENPRDPKKIRERHIELSKVYRERFTRQLQKVLGDFSVDEPANELMVNGYYHKMIRSYDPSITGPYGESFDEIFDLSRNESKLSDSHVGRLNSKVIFGVQLRPIEEVKSATAVVAQQEPTLKRKIRNNIQAGPINKEGAKPAVLDQTTKAPTPMHTFKNRKRPESEPVAKPETYSQPVKGALPDLDNFHPYTWPNSAFPFRLLYKSKRCRIFYIQCFPHNWNWLKEYREYIGDNDYFFVAEACHYDETVLKNHEIVFKLLNLNKNNFCFLSNTKKMLTRLESMGFSGILCNNNAWLDWSVFYIEQAKKRYDAIYTGRLTKVKRHYLASGIDNLALIVGPQYRKILDNIELPKHAYINQEHLPATDIRKKLAESSCGIILSAAEGACYASSEYLLAGLPVVSTRSEGGRNIWYDDYNSIICEPRVEAVAEAVKYFKNNPRDPRKIRQRHIDMSLDHRRRFVDQLQSVLDRFGETDNAQELLDQGYYNKMVTAYNPRVKTHSGETFNEIFDLKRRPRNQKIVGRLQKFGPMDMAKERLSYAASDLKNRLFEDKLP